MNPGVPYEIASHILGYLPLEFIEHTTLLSQLFPNVNVGLLVRDRCSPVRLFSRVVPDPMELMRVMLHTRVGLVGSRATDYFLPGTCAPKSDWDFICPNNYYQATYFLGYLDKIGFRNVVFNDAYSGRPELFSVKGTLEFAGVKNSINVIKSDYAHGIYQVLEFDMSVCTCCITGAGAYSLYSAMTQNSKSMVSSTYESEPDDESGPVEEDRLDKYKSRGIECVWERAYSDEYSRVSHMSRSRNRLRSSGDKDSYVVSFVDASVYRGPDRECALEMLESMRDVIWWHEPYGITRYNTRPMYGAMLGTGCTSRNFRMGFLDPEILQYTAQQEGLQIVERSHHNPGDERDGILEIHVGFDDNMERITRGIAVDTSGIHGVPRYIHQLYEYPSSSSMDELRQSMSRVVFFNENEFTEFMGQGGAT